MGKTVEKEREREREIKPRCWRTKVQCRAKEGRQSTIPSMTLFFGTGEVFGPTACGFGVFVQFVSSLFRSPDTETMCTRNAITYTLFLGQVRP